MTRTRYGLALASAATLASRSCGGLVGAASADPGGVPHHGSHGQHAGHDKHGDKGKDRDQGKPGKGHGNGHANGHANGHGPGNGNANGHAHAPGQQQGGTGAGSADPAGNNGTVKIAAPSDAVGHPSNNPHPGCSVVVEWFGFDAGDDVVSTVTFAAQAPTSDVTIGGTSPATVFVGGDAASGGTDLDGRQAYALTFTGEPHPKQGFHVKLTVATPHSLGNDTKSKVFWVEPCEPTTEEGVQGQGATSHTLSTPQTPSTPPSDVSGPTLAVDEPGGSTVVLARSDSDAPVPTAVDAGQDATVLPDWARSPLPLTAVAGGLVLVGAAIARRARRSA
jgi:hypothetical protein